MLKWAGGKTQLLGEILPLLPERVNTYYEPFMGGAAVFFELAAQNRFKKAVLSDKNRELVAVYRALQEDVEKLISRLTDMQDQHSEAFYYAVRASTPKDRFARAARLMYLNKTGYNGLYRVNSKGGFNVPFGRYKNPKICDAGNLRACALLLQKAEIRNLDFEEVCREAKKGDAIYLDPPYVPVSKTSNFTSYHADSFALEEHERLSKLFSQLARRGISAVLSNSSTPETQALYEDFRYRLVRARRSINSNGGGRGVVEELLVSTKDLKHPSKKSASRKSRRL
ncbi:MAG: DNA adenine methylase [Polyangiaceae bacterium]|nr:DNA adenine methylase [Polyangiaceae bacterium]